MAADEVTKAGSKVCQLSYNPNILTETNVQWKIEYLDIVDGVQHYKITNRATLNSSFDYIMCANSAWFGSDVIIDPYIGNNGSYLDEWTFEFVYDSLVYAT